MWLFLKSFGILIAKVFENAARQTTHNAKIKTIFEKLKESDRKEKK